MAKAAAQDWTLEHTDAKGYWVSTPAAVESRTGFPASDFDVPEFTLSGSEPGGTFERWEVIDTQIPDNAFMAPGDDDPTPKGPRIANVLVAREPSHNTPVATPRPAPARVQMPAASVQPAPAVPAPAPMRDPKAIAAELARKAASGTLSLDERRALAAEMAAAAKATRPAPAPVVTVDEPRQPGTLPPMEELAEPALPASSREAWGWDEADPLAVAERPSLSVVQATDDESYDDYLATPLPSPPRPAMQVPWPLPAPRARLVAAPADLPLEPSETDLVDVMVVADDETPEVHAPKGSVLPWLVLFAGVTVLLGAVLVGTMGLTVVTGLVAMALLA